MALMRSTEKKRTTAFHLTVSVLRRIDLLARLRGTNRSHETDKLLREAFELEHNRSDLAAAVAIEQGEVA